MTAPGANFRQLPSGISYSLQCRSVPQMPQAAIFTSSSFGSGIGSGTSSITSGCPRSLNTAAFIGSLPLAALGRGAKRVGLHEETHFSQNWPR